MADFEIHLDEENEFRFSVTTEGTDATAEVHSRMVIDEGRMSISFPGTNTGDGEVSVTVPPLAKIMTEGVYPTRLEVIVDDRIFIPIEMEASFKQSMKVMAESIVKPRRIAPRVTVTSVKRSTASSLAANIRKMQEQTEVTPPTRPQASKKKKAKPAKDNAELRELLRKVIQK